MNRCYENMELLEIQGKEKKNFFISYVDVPGKDEEITVEHVVEQLRRKVLEPLHERYGTDISDAAMRKAVEKHNEICRIISEMGEMRKAENPVITGAEFHKIVLATYVCPKDLILDKLYETLEGTQTQGDRIKKSNSRCKEL